MRFERLVAFVTFAVCVFASPLVLAQSPEPAPAEEAMALKASRAADGAIDLAWVIAPGVYLYRDKIAAASGGRPVPVGTPPAKRKDDPTFGPAEIYDATFSAKVEARHVDPSAPLDVSYQGCAARGVCYPPITKRLNLADIPETGAETSADFGRADAAVGHQDRVADKPSASPTVPSSSTSLAPDLEGDIAIVLATFFGLGLLLALTPCVYPMIPILVGVLARSGEALSPRRGLALSLSYVLAMATAYGALGVVAAWSGQNLQTALQTPVALTLASIVFVVLALSMFGLVQLQAPSAIASRVAPLTSRARGSAFGAAALGFVSALIVGPCVTPPLAAALVYVAQTGDVVRGSAALFALGLGMGAPLVAVGVFGARILPKSGRWLEGIKHGFGVVFLGIAILLIGRVAPPAATLALWALFAIGIGVFLGALDASGPDGSVWRRLSKAAGVAAIFYGAALVAGAASGADDALRPLSRLAMAPAPSEARTPEATVDSAAGLAAALQAARASGRPSLVMFTASWCVACAENETAMSASGTLQERLRDFSVIKVDVTGNDAKAKTVMKDHRVFGPPTILFYDRRGAELSNLRSSGAVNLPQFEEKLRQTQAT
jgi:thiol:disulfide interchange protein DsbD